VGASDVLPDCFCDCPDCCWSKGD